jgi:hypothetical protein
MAEQDLDHPDIDVLLEQVGGKAVPQHMHGHRLVDPAMSAAAWQARLSWREGCNSSSSDRTRLLSPNPAHLAAEPYRASGLVQ